MQAGVMMTIPNLMVLSDYSTCYYEVYDVHLDCHQRGGIWTGANA